MKNTDEIIFKFIKELKEFFIFFYKKPLHTIIIGIALILISLCLYKSIKILLIGSVTFAFGIATIIEIRYTKNKYKKQILAYHNELSKNEQEIIDYCLKNNSLAFRPDILSARDYSESIYSLVQKGYGTNISYGGDFLLFNETYEILKSLHKSKNENKIKN